jgi:hypothetical protein
MNEAGKTFRKLICNYENAHTRRHRFSWERKSEQKILETRNEKEPTGKGVACDLKITCCASFLPFGASNASIKAAETEQKVSL